MNFSQRYKGKFSRAKNWEPVMEMTTIWRLLLGCQQYTLGHNLRSTGQTVFLHMSTQCWQKAFVLLRFLTKRPLKSWDGKILPEVGSAFCHSQKTWPYQKKIYNKQKSEFRKPFLSLHPFYLVQEDLLLTIFPLKTAFMEVQSSKVKDYCI